MRLRNDIDIHTHGGKVRDNAVLCIDPTEHDDLPPGEGLISVGIHPWNANNATPQVWQRFNQWLCDRRVVAVGEAGLDRRKGPGMDEQMEVFERQARMAAEKGLPLIIHCVKAADILLSERAKLTKGMVVKPQWIYHGFRGNPVLAQQLLDAEIDLSFGKHYNPQAYDMVPPERRYFETD